MIFQEHEQGTSPAGWGVRGWEAFRALIVFVFRIPYFRPLLTRNFCCCTTVRIIVYSLWFVVCARSAIPGAAVVVAVAGVAPHVLRTARPHFSFSFTLPFWLNSLSR